MNKYRELLTMVRSTFKGCLDCEIIVELNDEGKDEFYKELKNSSTIDDGFKEGDTIEFGGIRIVGLGMINIYKD